MEDGGYDKAKIVATLNRKFGTTLEVEVLELAIEAGFSADWEVLWLEAATFLAQEEPELQSIAALTNFKVM